MAKPNRNKRQPGGRRVPKPRGTASPSRPPRDDAGAKAKGTTTSAVAEGRGIGGLLGKLRRFLGWR